PVGPLQPRQSVALARPRSRNDTTIEHACAGTGGHVGLSAAPSAADLSQCVHCGLCLQNCPTYLLTGFEAESPRGRIHLIQALGEGRVEPNAAYREHIELCLVCRNCETVCPSGVPFGRIMEAARARLYEEAPLSLADRVFRRLAFK